MSYVQEPYAQFVDDLLRSLTGGVAREQFTFSPDGGPFRLAPPAPLHPASLEVFGQRNGGFVTFQVERDYQLAGNDLQWRARPDGTPAADALWPDPGTLFFANYDVQPVADGTGPLLTDRNAGSVVRTLAESLAREYAVVSRQLEGVYRSGFVETATGRDLDQLVALVGVTRLTRSAAVGTLVLSRSSPATGDIEVAAGTRASTTQPPEVVYETTEARFLRRGTLSVEVPIVALTPGAPGVVGARAITALHRPIFGIDQVWNPQATRLSGEDETDEALRARARRALETAGRATTGAMLGALATIPQVREKDVRLAEDPLTRPGVVTLNIAVPLSPAEASRAVRIIEETRPVGVRVVHNLDSDSPGGVVTPRPNADDDAAVPAPLTIEESGEATRAGGALFFPVAVKAVVVPNSATLTAGERAALRNQAMAAIQAVVADAGIGEAVVYNRLVERVMAIPGVLDVTLDLHENRVGVTPPSHRNLIPPRTLRPTILESEGGLLRVDVGGQLVALDVEVALHLVPAPAAGADVIADLEDARTQVAGQLRDGVRDLASLSVNDLLGKVTPSEHFVVDDLSFTVEYVNAGVRRNQTFTRASAAIPVATLEELWVRTVRLRGPA